MKPKISFLLSFILLLFITDLSGQIQDFRYRRQITDITGSWHKIILPAEIYSNISADLSDIRIIGFTERNDTIEAPYIFEELSEQITQNLVAFKTLNQTEQNGRYFYTFEIPSIREVNEIALSFDEQNFDRKIKLEGSQQMDEWFTILDKYRILSIHNNHTGYNFNVLKFRNTRYRYYRLSFESNFPPELLSATISEQTIIQGVYRDYMIQSLATSNDKKTNETIITTELTATVPVSYIKIAVNDKFDYYRPVEIQYLTDSVESPKGWIYNYSYLASGTLNSLENNEFKFTNTLARRIRIIITNNNNEPLTIDTIVVKGNMHQLMIRFSKPATYYLYYGSINARSPIYDLTNFKDKVPEILPRLTVGNEELVSHQPVTTIKPLFQNKVWLWVIMSVIILLLGGFTLKMIKK